MLNLVPEELSPPAINPRVGEAQEAGKTRTFNESPKSVALPVLAIVQIRSKSGIARPSTAAIPPGDLSPACFINSPRVRASLNPSAKLIESTAVKALISPIE
jgi:hypothetical protein